LVPVSTIIGLCPLNPFMVSIAKKKRDIVDLLKSGAVEAVQLAVPWSIGTDNSAGWK
jgi:hypothetical protein